jgi:hypothetical protein
MADIFQMERRAGLGGVSNVAIGRNARPDGIRMIA